MFFLMPRNGKVYVVGSQEGLRTLVQSSTLPNGKAFPKAAANGQDLIMQNDDPAMLARLVATYNTRYNSNLDATKAVAPAPAPAVAPGGPAVPPAVTPAPSAKPAVTSVTSQPAASVNPAVRIGGGATLVSAPAGQSSLDLARAKAKAEGKMLFVEYGWDKCGNCKNFRRLLANNQVMVPESEFVMVNVHPREGSDRTKFTEYFGIKQGVYPRIVITSPDGQILGSRFGYGAAKQYNDLISEAKGKLAALDTPAPAPAP